ncbi:sigma-70 family RNA polymerase sigma factor [Rheinheimera sp. 4Y26]|nr:sigma-70 family RNA polymerase sigma factor [Rheinheimera sp. 4Y26]
MVPDVESRLDLALVKRVLLNEDRQAFNQLVRRHQSNVRAQLRRLCRNDNAWADDLAQDTFLQAWRKLSQFRSEARFSTWLYRIAHNCFLQAYRQQPIDEMQEETLLDQATGPRQRAGLQHDLQKALQALPEGERLVMLYHTQMGLSHEETADITGLPLGTVKTHATRGSARLRQWLKDYQSNENTGVTT